MLTAAGVILFGLLSVAYSVFYGRLGVNPDVVGLNYATTLTRSTGLLALLAVAAVLALRVLLRRHMLREADDARVAQLLDAQEDHERRLAENKEAVARIEEVHAGALEYADEHGLDDETAAKVTHLEAELAKARSELRHAEETLAVGRATAANFTIVKKAVDVLTGHERRRSALGWAATVAALLLVLIPLLARPRADAVRRGEAVEPIGILGLTFLDVSARPARVVPAGDVPKAPNVVRLGHRRLLYLGQGDGSLVLFDPVDDRAIQLPAGAAVLRVQAPG